MTTPNPDVVAKELAWMAEQCAKLAADYAWMYAAGWERRNSTPGKRPDDALPDDGDRGTVVELIVIHQRHTRHQVEQAAKLLLSARGAMQGAAAALGRAAASVDNHGAELPGEHDRRTPRTASVRDIETARRAQARRQARGEGVA